MCENCKCEKKESDGLQQKANTIGKRGRNFYFAVDDITFYRAHYDKFEENDILNLIEEYGTVRPNHDYHFRDMNNRFDSNVHEALIRALLNAIHNSSGFNLETNQYSGMSEKEALKIACEEVYFNPETGCFIWDEYLTIGTEQRPKDCQFERYFNGDYEFILCRHEIQVLQTLIPKFDPEKIYNEISS